MGHSPSITAQESHPGQAFLLGMKNAPGCIGTLSNGGVLTCRASVRGMRGGLVKHAGFAG